MALLQEFKEFAIRGNAVDMAVGIIVGAAFNELVNTLVKGIILPPLSLLTGDSSLVNRFWVLSGGAYQTLADADADAAIIVRYGQFLNQLIDFIVIAFVVFVVVKVINHLRRNDEATEKTK